MNNQQKHIKSLKNIAVSREEAAQKFFEELRWNSVPNCPHCGSQNIAQCKDQKPMPYRCKACRKHFSVRTGTVLEESRLPLQKWVQAICALTEGTEDLSLMNLADELDVAPKTAALLAERIHFAWETQSNRIAGNNSSLKKKS